MLRLASAGIVILALMAGGTCVYSQNLTQTCWQVLESGQKSPHSLERVAAVRALGLLPGEPEATQLVEESLHDQKSDVRAAAATSLGRMRSLTSIPLLQQSLKDKDARVNFAAANALLSMGDSSGYNFYYEVLIGGRKSGEGPVEEQKKLIKDNRAMTMMILSVGMGFAPYAGYGWAMYQALSKDYDGPVLVTAATKLADDPGPQAVQALVQAATNKRWRVRQAALEAPAQRSEPGALESAALHLNDKKVAVRCAAAAAVLRLSAAQAAEPKAQQGMHEK